MIIAAFNAQPFVAETINSILAQTHSHVEIILIDDASTDGTAAVVERMPQVRLIKLTQNGGPSRARNIGAAAASGEYLAFFDADDLMTPQRLETQVAFLQSHPTSPAVLMDYRNFSEEGNAVHSHFDSCISLRKAIAQASAGEILLSTDASRNLLLGENFSITGSILFRSKAFAELGGFDESLKVGEDFELVYRACALGPLGIIDREAFMRRMHATNVSNRRVYNLREKIRTREKILSTETDAERKRTLRAILAELALDLSRDMAGSSPRESFGYLRRSLRYGQPFLSSRFLRVVLKTALGALDVRRMFHRHHGARA